jgi:hypothetical protein
LTIRVDRQSRARWRLQVSAARDAGEQVVSLSKVPRRSIEPENGPIET